MMDQKPGNAGCSGSACGSNTASQMASSMQDELIAGSLAKIKNKLIVMSGKGGVGKSSIAANLAVALAQKGFKTGLMDVDLHGPSISQMMGLEGLLDITPDRRVLPMAYNQHLKVVSMQSLMTDANQAVIWRGPAKTGIIRQFVADVLWEDLDFLIIDCPPGTGDEPLSVAQTISDAKALVITTPQEVALLDVRKSINFCRTINLQIIGLLENMGPFVCPDCGEAIELFKSGGGAETALKMDIPFLGSLPFDPAVVITGDSGTPIVDQNADSQFAKALNKCITNIINRL
ncbi:MAG: Mrp/NBP35 family ATP-binding protein [Desulfobacterales bacterium]|nr:Mrp/NBP35 family ATP-binding protein [Desulfobacterales bacterium]